MAESSGPWDGSSFAEDEWRKLFRAFPDGRLKAGIANSLEITRSVSNREITISAGKAVVQGMLYENTADVIINVPTPSGSNQRVDYIVLRRDESQPLADRIKLALKQGAEALSGAIPPALTQSETGIWEHPLCVIGPYATGVISAAPFALISPVVTRRAYITLGSYASPNAMPGLVGSFRDEVYDETGQAWQLNASGVWVLTNAGAGVPAQDNSTTDQTVTAVWPTFQAGSPSCGVAFVAPSTGRVTITVSAYMQTSQNGRRVFVSSELRTGSTIGAGTVVTAPSDIRSVMLSPVVVTGVPSYLSASIGPELITGLTPGASYNVRTMQTTYPAQPAVVYNRRILVLPA